MAFQLTPLHIPTGATNYGAENQAFANLGQTLGNLPSEMRKEQLNAQKQQLLGSLASGNADFNKIGLGIAALGDPQGGAAIASLGQKQQALDAQKGIASIFGGGGAAAPNSSASPASVGSPNEVESRFIGTVQKAGLTNPIGLGAVAAYGKAESGYDPGNVNKTWSDPSESGGAGTSGGIMSWRADRLQNLQRFAAERGEQGNGSPETQAAFLAKEDPTLIPRLNAAQSPQEANQIMAQAWRFAGHDRPGQGEFARREGLTSAYAQRFSGQPGAQTPGVQVAENEADVQRLEQQQAARSGQPVQMAQAAPAPGAPVADAPAPGAANAGFNPPGANMLPPNDPAPRASNQMLMAIIANPNAADGQRALAKTILDNRIKYSDENAPDKREMTRLQTEKLRREVEGDAVRSLVTPEERAAAGVDPNYKGTVQIDRSGKVTFPGKASTEVNVNSGEKTYDQTVGKAQGEYFVETQKGARDARDQITTMKRMQSLIDDPNFYSGWNGGRATAFKKLAVSLGIKDAEAAAPNELFEKLSKQAVLDKAGGSFGTGFSNGDREYIDATTANPNNTPEGNRQILDAGIKIAQRKIEVAKMARDYAKANGGRLDGGFDDLLADYAEKNPLFPQVAKQPQPAAPTSQPQQQEAPRQVQSIDDVRGLPSGTIFIDPNGVKRRVP